DAADAQLKAPSLHDALPISAGRWPLPLHAGLDPGPDTSDHGDDPQSDSPGNLHGDAFSRRTDRGARAQRREADAGPPQFKDRSRDRKSTRLNSSHVKISYAV